MIWCPRCDQGWVIAARVKGRDDTFLVCKECDTVWEDGNPVAKAPYVILEEYMARFGKSQLWSNLEQLEG